MAGRFAEPVECCEYRPVAKRTQRTRNTVGYNLRRINRYLEGGIMFKTILTAAALVALTAMPASAACPSANAAGLWRLYAGSSNQSGAYWVKCTLVLGKDGKLGSASNCQTSWGLNSLVTGSITVTAPALCTLTGSLTFTSGGNVGTVTEATMSQDKKSATGVGTFSGDGFQFTMLRVR
jgi:hypothetical protein